MRVIGIIQARLASARLPIKVLAPIGGRSLLQVLVERLRSVPAGCPSVDDWWLATTDTSADDVLVAWGEELGLKIFRGDEEDVLDRFVGVLALDPADWIVRATADDPFMDGAFIGSALPHLDSVSNDIDLLADWPHRKYPLGYVPQLIRSRALVRAASNIPPDQPWHRTHAGASWLIQEEKVASWPLALDPTLERPQWRMTIDTPADLAAGRALFSALGDEWREASYKRLVEVFDQHPELFEINQYAQQKNTMEG